MTRETVSAEITVCWWGTRNLLPARWAKRLVSTESELLCLSPHRPSHSRRRSCEEGFVTAVAKRRQEQIHPALRTGSPTREISNHVAPGTSEKGRRWTLVGMGDAPLRLTWAKDFRSSTICTARREFWSYSYFLTYVSKL